VNNLKDTAELLTGVGTIVLSSTAIFAFFSYRRQIKREGIKWLQQLYEQFYNQNRYKPVRQRIDFDDLDDLIPLLYRHLRQRGPDRRNELADCSSNRDHALNLRTTYNPITANYPRISAMRIVTAVTRPRMSASPG
jgi:hypothetical protein